MEQLIAALEAALPSVASFFVIGLVTYTINKMRNGGLNIKTFMKEHREIVDQQQKNTELITDLTSKVDKLSNDNEDIKSTLRNDVKSHIVSVYERALERDYITPMELETVNRLNDSYHNVLKGNTYIHVIVRQMNNQMTIRGTEIPEH